MIYKKMTGKNKNNGFTLIEILVVVAIIAVLASIVLVGLGPTQRLGRDARRLSDLRQTQNGLELYLNKCGYYPGVAQAGVTCGAFQQISAWSDVSGALTQSNLGVYQVPNDPIAAKTYSYGTNAGGSEYTIGAQLEDLNNPSLQQSIDGTSDGVPCSRSTGFYCIKF